MKNKENQANRLKITPLFIAICEAIELMAAPPALAANDADGFFLLDGLAQVNTTGYHECQNYMSRDKV